MTKSLLEYAREMRAKEEAKKKIEAAEQLRIKLQNRIAELSALAADIRQGRTSYGSCRRRIFELHFSLNKHKHAAPAFRPLVRRQWLHGSEGDQVFRDQQIIDMHWLSCNGVTGWSPQAKSVISASFSATAAEAFAAETHKLVAKAAAFKLDRQHQMECIWICNGSLRRKRDELIARADAHRERLRRKIEKRAWSSPSERASLVRIDIEKVSATWLSHEIAVLLWKRTEPSLADRTLTYRMITGDTEVTRGTIRHQSAQARKHIGGST